MEFVIDQALAEDSGPMSTEGPESPVTAAIIMEMWMAFDYFVHELADISPTFWTLALFRQDATAWTEPMSTQPAGIRDFTGQ